MVLFFLLFVHSPVVEPTMKQAPVVNQQPQATVGGVTIATFKCYTAPIFAGTLAAVTIAVCYYFSCIVNGTSNCWPATDITHTARYPPAEYIFRVGIPIAMVILMQVWWVIFSWLKAEEGNTRWGNPLLGFAFIFGIMGAVLLIIASVLIQPGQMDWTLHTIGATGFFLFTFVAQVIVTGHLASLMATNPTITSPMSLKIKQTTVSLFFTALITDAINELGYGPFGPNLGNVVEYFVTLMVLIWFVSCAIDFKDRLILNLVLSSPSSSPSPSI
uniref:CWH43-like N-terminal domain-containing protein n=1 Tax=Paramoeba aestuarina TaxID=180227 RepID=A0A7S4UZL1_9EUKA